MTKIAVLGDIFTDIQTGPISELPKECGDLKAKNIEILLGGSAANVARYLGFNKEDVMLFTAVGTDSLSSMQLSLLQEEGYVKTEGSVTVLEGEKMPVAIVLYGPFDRTFISNNGALDKFTASKINKELLFSCNHIHISGYFVCLALHSPEFTALLREAKDKKITLSFDCQYDSTQKWTGKNNHLSQLLPLMDVFMPSDYEAAGISKIESVEDSAEHISNMMKSGTVIIKNGDKGVYIKKWNEPGIRVPAYPVDNVIDSTGAGDSFNAGFISQLRHGNELKNQDELLCTKNIKKACEYGCAMGSIAIQHVGAFVKNASRERAFEVLG